MGLVKYFSTYFRRFLPTILILCFCSISIIPIVILVCIISAFDLISGHSTGGSSHQLILHHHPPPQFNRGVADPIAASLPKPPPPPIVSKSRLGRPSLLAASNLPRNSAATLPRNFGQTMVIRRSRQGTTTIGGATAVAMGPALKLPSPPCPPPSTFALSALVCIGCTRNYIVVLYWIGLLMFRMSSIIGPNSTGFLQFLPVIIHQNDLLRFV